MQHCGGSVGSVSQCIQRQTQPPRATNPVDSMNIFLSLIIFRMVVHFFKNVLSINYLKLNLCTLSFLPINVSSINYLKLNYALLLFSLSPLLALYHFLILIWISEQTILDIIQIKVTLEFLFFSFLLSFLFTRFAVINISFICRPAMLWTF